MQHKNLKIVLVFSIILALGISIAWYLSQSKSPSSPPYVDPLTIKQTLTPEQIIAKEEALNNPELNKKVTLTPKQIAAKKLLIKSLQNQ